MEGKGTRSAVCLLKAVYVKKQTKNLYRGTEDYSTHLPQSKQLFYIHIRMALRKFKGKNTFLMAPSLSAQENDIKLPCPKFWGFSFWKKSKL